MNSEIIGLVKELNGSIVSNINDQESVVLDGEFMFLKGNYRKYYHVLDYKIQSLENKTLDEYIVKGIKNEEIISSDILNKIENEIIYNELIKKIPANLIYSIIILKVDQINEELYKTIIKIEEDEYFSKKYVFYYTEEELNKFNLWKKECNAYSFDTLLNYKENAKILEDKDKSIPLKFMLRLLVKLPFLKVNIESTHINNFDEELKNIIGKIRNEKERDSIEKINSQIFRFIDQRENIDKAIEDYFILCKGV